MRDDAKHFARGLLAVMALLAFLCLGAFLVVTAYLPPDEKLSPNEFKGPMLEQAEGEVLGRVRVHEERLLHAYEWVDRPQGLARVPIEVAIEVIAARSSTAAQGGSR